MTNENEASTPAHILYVVTLASRTGRYGGPFDIASEQARIMQRAGRRVSLLAGVLPGDGPDADTPTQGHRYVPVTPVSSRLPLVSLVSTRMAAELWRQVGRHRATHVSMSRELIPLVASLFAVVRRRPLVVQPHGMLTSRTSRSHRAADAVVRPLMRRADVVLALTTTEAQELRERYGVAALVIGNPVAGIGPGREVTRRGGSSTADVLFLARLQERKRVQDFAGAALVAGDHGWPERYSVVGPDEGDLPRLRALVDRVEGLAYEGALSQRSAVERVAACDIFVLTSRGEPWGNALAVALTCGKPVVVPASCAFASAITRHGAGLVYEDEDVATLATCVHRLAAERGTYEACARGALLLAQDMLSPDGYGDRLLRAYEGIPALRR